MSSSFIKKRNPIRLSQQTTALNELPRSPDEQYSSFRDNIAVDFIESIKSSQKVAKSYEKQEKQRNKVKIITHVMNYVRIKIRYHGRFEPHLHTELI